jgi:dipeptidyl aminopeptidase/acylaminoacyl peptidase
VTDTPTFELEDDPRPVRLARRQRLATRGVALAVPILLVTGLLAAVAHDDERGGESRVATADNDDPVDPEELVIEVPSTVTTVASLPVEVPKVTVPKLPRLPKVTVPTVPAVPTIPTTQPACPATPAPFVPSDLGLYEISISDNNGRLVQQIEEPRFNQDHTYSPDGTRVAFVRIYRDNDGQTPSELYIANRDFSGERKVELPNLHPGGLEWSPDGRYLSYTAQPKPGEQQAVYVLDVAANTARQVSGTSTMGTGGATWSRDSTHLAWASNSEGGFWVADAATWTVRKLADDPVVSLAWSPDGRQLALGRVGGGVYLFDRDGSNRRRVHETGIDVAWSPKDRSRMVVGTDGALYRVDPDTGGSTFLRGGFVSDWLPDGSRIIIGSRDGIGLVDWSGCFQTVVPLDGTKVGLWAWTPDSKAFLVCRFQ